MSRFIDDVAALGRELSSTAIEAVCGELEKLPPSSPRTAWTATTSDVQPAESRARIAELVERWPGSSPAELALALRVADRTDRLHRELQTIELVWTGPVPQNTRLRRTDQVLLDMIESAESSILIVMFAAYHVPAIREALVRAADRGVLISFLFESKESSEGRITFDGLCALGDLASRCEVLTWPLEQRERDARGTHGTLHAKCAVVDGKSLLVSSANLTEFAMTMNMELGVVIRGGDLPRNVHEHFEGLRVSGILSREA